jgi:hypothetical protein
VSLILTSPVAFSVISAVNIRWNTRDACIKTHFGIVKDASVSSSVPQMCKVTISSVFPKSPKYVSKRL